MFLVLSLGALIVASSSLSAIQPQTVRTEVLQRAAALIAQHNLPAAEEALRPVFDQAPDDAVALNLLGVIRMQQGKIEESVSLFEKAIHTGHKIAGPHVNLAVVYGANRPLDAIAELKEALTMAPADPQAVSLIRQIAKSAALAAVNSGNKQKAIAILTKAAEAAPNDPELLYELALVSLDSGLYHEAEDKLTQALRLEPKYSDATYALARTYLAENLAGPAENQMREYLAAKPEDASALYGLGYILMIEQRPGEAKPYFEKSLTLRPSQTESTFQLGEIALLENRNDEASEKFHRVLDRDPHHGGALTELGVLAFRAARYEKAKSNLEQAIKGAPTYQKAHYYYALTLAKLGRKADAEHEFELAKSLQKEHGAELGSAATQP